MATVRRPAIQNHANFVPLFADEKDPDLLPNLTPPSHESGLVKAVDEGASSSTSSESLPVSGYLVFGIRAADLNSISAAS